MHHWFPVQEEAVQRWVVALGSVERVLRQQHRPPPAPRPHLALLHRQLIVALLHRLDTLLFRCACSRGGGADSYGVVAASCRAYHGASRWADGCWSVFKCMELGAFLHHLCTMLQL